MNIVFYAGFCLCINRDESPAFFIYNVLKICRLSLHGKGVFYEKVVGS